MGYDVDEFATTAVRDMTFMWTAINRQDGGLRVGFNHDAKLRRQTTHPDGPLWGHIGARDALAWGLLSAAKLGETGILDDVLAASYPSWSSDAGIGVLEGKATLDGRAEVAFASFADGFPTADSGHHEEVEHVLQACMASALTS